MPFHPTDALESSAATSQTSGRPINSNPCSRAELPQNGPRTARRTRIARINPGWTNQSAVQDQTGANRVLGGLGEPAVNALRRLDAAAETHPKLHKVAARHRAVVVE